MPLALLLLAATDANACGGFFCNNLNPVDQAGETIVFGVSTGLVTTHVRIDYDGDAEDFAWVLPVPGEPELFLSSPVLFDMLEPLTAIKPVWRVDGCPRGTDAESDADADADSDSDTDVSLETGGLDVDVISQTTVGPYDTVVLRAGNAADLVAWLDANDYGVPPTLTDKVGPYLTANNTFLALKLAPGTPTGQLAPLGLRWIGTQPSIPLVLTSVAARPDMPLTVYLLGPARGVPLNMPHFELNPLAYGWSGQALSARLGQGADEAGGRAFTTAFAGTHGLNGALYAEGRFRLDGLEQITDPMAWFTALPSYGFTGGADLLEVLRLHVPAPDGVSETNFYNDPVDYARDWATLNDTFDPVAATAELDLRVVSARRDAQRMLDGGPYLTRLETVMSPEEMVIDPTFGFNPDLEPVSDIRLAHIDCDDTVTRALHLPGGYTVLVPPDLRSRALVDWLDSQIGHVALTIDQFSESGPGERLADYRYELTLPLPEFLGAPSAPASCGCRSTGAAMAPVLGGVALLLLRRRRPHIR